MSADVVGRFGGNGFGNVGLGVAGDGPRHCERRDLCAAFGHPAVTFNPWPLGSPGQSWCLCGRAVSVGNAIEWPKPTDCGGYLVDCLHLGAPS